MKIGWTNRGYPVERTILDKIPGVEYVRSRSFAVLGTRVLARTHVPIRGGFKFGGTYVGGTSDTRVDMFHFFNLLGGGLCRRPFVTTFETSVPRYLEQDDYWFKRGLESLMGNRCRKLLALSDCAKRIQLGALKTLLSEQDMVVLEKKIEVLHPPQKILSDGKERGELSPSNGLKAIFVGRDLFRKGGGEALRAFARLRKDFPVELWIIGDWSRLGYACDAIVDDGARHRQLIEKNKDWVHWSPSLPNETVLELMRTCDIGLLPTRADTYGYSVLEMQACGLPVITTDVRALPEINDDKCGWVIQGCGQRDGTGVFGEADYSSRDKLAELSEKIEQGVYEKITEAIGNRGQVRQKGLNARKRVVEKHDPVKYAQSLYGVYMSALS